ncbi:Hpt domain-containing protein [Methylobacterium aerolatum]|uniref:HPt (Histidine-containing phosphotransfer) domain-containing protein n=1 Tax=Methylobacterium aerolatum TaxID=418708 RepID=A0ABU0HZ79_9HYPH|nr:Hpt domain-containing protein [Methylobacterium aerolatum]MDQ0447652.1 HPt (histidine-containing phosphotransfer) domain-containing protein [Methylobacterium aerolatum]GJD34752.1 hypothetical protein FMGBMHLM_1655 [Methylobacterium aerolatum]
MSGSLILNTTTRDELGATIGREKLDRLTGRLRDLLSTALRGSGRDGTEVGREAHTLVSMAGMLGFDALSEACRNLEYATQRGGDFAPDLREAARLRDETLAALANV